jgi:hypothetical protein
MPARCVRPRCLQHAGKFGPQKAVVHADWRQPTGRGEGGSRLLAGTQTEDLDSGICWLSRNWEVTENEKAEAVSGNKGRGTGILQKHKCGGTVKRRNYSWPVAWSVKQAGGRGNE